jgi:hypothetical protein
MDKNMLWELEPHGLYALFNKLKLGRIAIVTPVTQQIIVLLVELPVFKEFNVEYPVRQF